MDTKIDYCISMVLQMSKEHRKDILQWLVLNIPNELIHENADGCRVIADKIPADKIDALYALIKYKLES